MIDVNDRGLSANETSCITLGKCGSYAKDTLSNVSGDVELVGAMCSESAILFKFVSFRARKKRLPYEEIDDGDGDDEYGHRRK
jgi:hypothetical protein